MHVLTWSCGLVFTFYTIMLVGGIELQPGFQVTWNATSEHVRFAIRVRTHSTFSIGFGGSNNTGLSSVNLFSTEQLSMTHGVCADSSASAPIPQTTSSFRVDSVSVNGSWTTATFTCDRVFLSGGVIEPATPTRVWWAVGTAAPLCNAAWNSTTLTFDVTDGAVYPHLYPIVPGFVHLHWSASATQLSLLLRAKAMKWAAVGWMPLGAAAPPSTSGADLVVGVSGGAATDYTVGAAAAAVPTPDTAGGGNNDASGTAAVDSDGWLSLRFTRPRFSGSTDGSDVWVGYPAARRVVWAAGPQAQPTDANIGAALAASSSAGAASGAASGGHLSLSFPVDTGAVRYTAMAVLDAPPSSPAAGGAFTLHWRRSGSAITMLAHALTRGWVGVGWGGGASTMMQNTDMVIGAMTGAATGTVADYVSRGFTAKPLLDTAAGTGGTEDVSGGWISRSASGWTSMGFTKPLDGSGDSTGLDASFPADAATRVIFAVGNADTFAYHSSRGSVTELYFSHSGLPPPQPPASGNGGGGGGGGGGGSTPVSGGGNGTSTAGGGGANRRIVTNSMTLALGCALTGAVFVLPLLAMVVVKRHSRVMRAVSAAFSSVVLCGALLALPVPLLMSLPATATTCNLVSYWSAFSVSTILGGVYTKTWRVVTIMNKSRTLQRVRIPTPMLFGMVIGLLVGDVLVLTPLILTNPVQIVLAPMPGAARIAVCEYGDTYTAVFFTWKGLLLLWGCILSIQVRNAPSEFNESKRLGFCIYSLTFSSGLFLLVTQMAESAARVHTLKVVGFTWGVLMTIGILFIPVARLLFLGSTPVVALSAAYEEGGNTLRTNR